MEAIGPQEDVFADIPIASAVAVSEFYSEGGVSLNSSEEKSVSAASPKRGKQQKREISSTENEGEGSSSSQKKNKSKKGKEPLSLSEQLAMTHAPRSGDSKSWPARLRADVIKSFTLPSDETNGAAYLRTHHRWNTGLCKLVFKSTKKIPIRFFIVDDSGSMSTNDGNRIIRSKGSAKVIKCTRWAELTDALHFHAELAEAAKAPTEFRLLNGADPVMVGLGNDNGEGLEFAKEVFTQDPAGTSIMCVYAYRFLD